MQNHREVEVGTFFEQIKSYVGWEPHDAQRVAAAWPLIQPVVPAIVDDFYRSILRHDFTARVITGGEVQIERLKQTLAKWLESLFSGDYGESFAALRWQVGRRHVEIGLNQAYAIAALTRLRIGITRQLCLVSTQPPHDLCHTIIAVNKLLDLDAAIIDFAYQQSFATQLEESAAAKVQQSERLAAIGQMVTGLAHESRNVLQRSHACLEALLLDIEDRPEALKQAHRIQTALDRLHLLYEEVRNYAAPINLDRESLDLARLIANAWHNLEPRWKEQQATLTLHCPQPADAILAGDRHRLDQVFTNLLQNAIDAAGRNGKIRCAISCKPGSALCQIDLEDNGPGIPSDRGNRIFEPFFTTKTKGTGLGLAITKRIIDAHQGQIAVGKSDLGGARITVILPAQ